MKIKLIFIYMSHFIKIGLINKAAGFCVILFSVVSCSLAISEQPFFREPRERFSDAPVVYSKETTPDSDGHFERIKVVNVSNGLIRIEQKLVHSHGVETLIRSTEMRANQIIVGLQPGIQVEEVSNKLGAKVVKKMLLPNSYVLEVPYEVDAVPKAVEFLNRQKLLVASVEPNHIGYAQSTVPNDLHYGDQWSFENTGQNGGVIGADIHAPQAWDFGTGSKNVVIAVIDTGVDYLHPDLESNIWSNPDEVENGVDDDGNGKIDDVIGWNFLNDNNDPMDAYTASIPFHGHGTSVSGVIGAVGNNNQAVTGVCWNVSMMPLRISNSGYDSDDLIDAIVYASDKGASVINCSLGGYSYSSKEKEAIDYAEAKGVLIVAASGNDGWDNDSSPIYPASYSNLNIISVTGTDSSDDFIGLCNYGQNSVDLGAPGNQITTTDYSSYSAPPFEWVTLWQQFGGTSAAAPHVSGVCALLKALKPKATSSEIKNAVLAGVDHLPSLVGKTTTGGRLNAYKAALALIGNLGVSNDNYTSENDTIIGDPSVLANDIGPDGIANVVVEVLQPPSHGNLQMSNDGSFVYKDTLSGNTIGNNDSFIYRFKIGSLYSPEAKVKLYTHVVKLSRTIWIVKENIFSPPCDPLYVEIISGDSFALTFKSESGNPVLSIGKEPSHGTLYLAESSVEYVPDSHFIGEDGFSFSIQHEGKQNVQGEIIIKTAERKR